VTLEVGDFNLDARQEVCLESNQLIAWVRPALGGHIYGLDVRENSTNLLATLDRRPELYHAAILADTTAPAEHQPAGHDADPARSTLARGDLKGQVVYDHHPRKALVDHFYAADLTLDDLIACRERELGDFALGTYLTKVQRDADRVAVVMERPGLAAGHSIHMRKTIELGSGATGMSVHYELDDLPPGVALHFAVEMNIAAMAGHAGDRYFSDDTGAQFGMLDTPLDLANSGGISLSDHWLDLAVGLTWSKSAGLWCFPIETVSQSDGGLERVYQSSAIVPHWSVVADDSRRWDVRIRWGFDRASAASVSQLKSSTNLPVTALQA
jgi:alpha-amylase